MRLEYNLERLLPCHFTQAQCDLPLDIVRDHQIKTPLYCQNAEHIVQIGILEIKTDFFLRR